MDTSRRIGKIAWVLGLALGLAWGTIAQATVPPAANFAKATVSSGYDSSTTSIVVSSGQGAKFPASGTYPLVWWNCTDYALSEDDPNVEIVLVTARSTDTLTITRGQDGTTAVNHNTANKEYCLVRSIVKYDIDAIRAGIGAAGGSITDVFDAAVYASFNDAVSASNLCANNDPKILRLSNAQIVASSVTVCPNVKIWRIGSGKLTVSLGASVTLDNPQQIIMGYRETMFDGGATQPVIFSNPGVVFPEWWGWNAATMAADGTTKFRMIIASLPPNSSKAGLIDFAGTTYLYDDKIATDSRNLWLRGLNKLSSHVLSTAVGNAKHGLYCTGTTNFLRATDLDWSPQSPLTQDNSQTGLRCDASNDAPSMPSGTIIEAWDMVFNGWNTPFQSDGESNMRVARATLLRAEITVGGSGSASGVNEGLIAIRTELLKAEDLIIHGASRGDHCLYALSVRSLNFRNYTCDGFLNEAVKVVSISPSDTGPDPRTWVLDSGTITDSGDCALIASDQDDTIHLVSMMNVSCHGVTGSGSNTAAITIQALQTSRIKMVRLDGATCSNSVHGCIATDTVVGSKIDHVSLKSQHYENWSTSSGGTYSAIVSTGSPATNGLLEYSGYFDGNNNGRQILAPTLRDVWTAVDAGPVIARRLTVLDENILTAQIGNGSTRGRVPTAIARSVTEASTTASTSEATLATLTIPAGTFCANGKSVRFSAAGDVAATANTKTIRAKLAGTTVMINGTTTAPNDQTWRIEGEILRTGLNTQLVTATMLVGGTPQTHLITTTAGTENAAMDLTITGQPGTAVANEIRFRVGTVDYGN